MSDNYTYPAILDYSENGFINIFFPDFQNLSTCVEVGENYVEAAQDLLVLKIMDFEDNDVQLPAPSFEGFQLTSSQQLIFVNIWMPYHRTKVKEIYTKKTLTIPVWLDILAKENNINFSATLVEALKEKLQLKK